jgi:nitrite reductase/ring-hydroxylating ferredoxin subunit
MKWQKVLALSQLPQGTRKHVVVDNHEYMVIHSAREGLRCVDHRCPHADGPVGDGMVLGKYITCPLHKWRFDLADGSHVHKGTRNLGVYKVRVEGDSIEIEIP